MRWTLAPALLLLAASGCMKIRDELLVMPDGSGRLSFTFAIASKAEAGKFTEAELMSGDPDEIQDKIRGLVAMGKPTLEEKDGTVRIRLTGYFDDLNALKIMDDGEGAKAKVKQEFVFRREGETFSVEVKGNLLAEEGPERPAGDPEIQKFREEMIKTMYAGFEFRQDLKLPGNVTSVEGFVSKDGRVAAYAVGEKNLQTSADVKKLNAITGFKASCGKSEVTDAEAAEWRRELEAAKAGWAELRKEMKKKAERK
jgi:hypothetical protein